MKSQEEIARMLHEVYETNAKVVGWKTQKECRVRFQDLPESNRLVMLRMADFVRSMIREELARQKDEMKYVEEEY